MLVYTFGLKEAYDKSIPGAVKIGERDNYPGGVIWMTRNSIESWLNCLPEPRRFDFGQGLVEVDSYGVEIESFDDVSSEGDPMNAPSCRRLLIDRPLVRLDPFNDL
mgnify:CR=1 FL=1